jgi:hypothetical protein
MVDNPSDNSKVVGQTLTSHIQRVVTTVLPIVVVAVQTYLTRNRTYGKDVEWTS